MDQFIPPLGERRLFNRKPCSRLINFEDTKHTYSGQVHNLTVGGAYIEPLTETASRVGQELQLTIPFRLKHDHINIKAKVAWTRPNGIGVKFISADTDH